MSPPEEVQMSDASVSVRDREMEANEPPSGPSSADVRLEIPTTASAAMRRTFHDFYTTQAFTDCTLVIGGKRDFPSAEGQCQEQDEQQQQHEEDAPVRVRVHRLLLAAACPSLSAALSDPSASADEEGGATVLMPDFDQDEAQALLNLVYGVPSSEESVLSVPASLVDHLFGIEEATSVLGNLTEKDRPERQKTPPVAQIEKEVDITENNLSEEKQITIGNGNSSNNEQKINYFIVFPPEGISKVVNADGSTANIVPQVAAKSQEQESDTQKSVKLSLPEITTQLLSFNEEQRKLLDEDDVRTALKMTVAQISEKGDRVRPGHAPPFRCYLCPATRKSEEVLLSHVTEEHGQDAAAAMAVTSAEMELRTFACCGRIYLDKLRWSRHRAKVHCRAVATVRQGLECALCRRRFVMTQELLDVSHDSSLAVSPVAVVDEGGLRCPLGCQKAFHARKALTAHVNECPMLQKVLCPMCGDILVEEDMEGRKRRVMTAISACGGLEALPEEISNSLLGNLFGTLKPKGRELPSTTEMTGESSSSSSEKLSSLTSGSMPPSPSRCSSDFASSAPLNEDDLVASARRKKSRHNYCNMCGERFPRFENLELHLKKAHGIINEYPCPQCGKIFSSLKMAKRHQNRHEGKYACGDCGKKFDHKTPLLMHR